MRVLFAGNAWNLHGKCKGPARGLHGGMLKRGMHMTGQPAKGAHTGMNKSVRVQSDRVDRPIK